MMSLTSFSPKVAMPLSMFFSSGEEPSSVVMSTAVERSLSESPVVFLAALLSMNDVELTKILLKGLKIMMSTFSMGAIIIAIDLAFLEA